MNQLICKIRKQDSISKYGKLAVVNNFIGEGDGNA